MSSAMPQLFADATGVWREDKPGQRHGMLWEDIYAVSGSKLDGVTEIYLSVVLDRENGHFMEFYQGWPGFTQVVTEIADRLTGIAPDWLEQLERLEVDDAPLEVRQRTRLW